MVARPRIRPVSRPARRRRPAALLLVVAVLLSLAACGGGGGGNGGGRDQSAGRGDQPSQAAAPSEPRVVRNESLRALGVSSDTSRKPEFSKPAGRPPSDLQIYDVKEGNGAEATAGRPLSMQYVGKTFSTGKEFDASWDRGQPFAFTLGAGEVIPGWDMGIAGMREGGRRILVIPPALAYGAQGSAPDIGPNEPLVFVVDLKKVGQ